MAKIECWFKQDLKKPVKSQVYNGSVFTLDNVGSLIGVEVYSDGEPVTLTGTVNGYVILPDEKTTVPVSGTRSENKAYIALPQSALAYHGFIRITIKLTNSSEITTLLRVVATVEKSRTDTVITPSQQIITDWSQQIAAEMQAVEDASAAQDAKITDLKSALSGNTAIYNIDNINNSIVWDDGHYPRYNNGTIADNANYTMTNLISVFPGSYITGNNLAHTAFYKADGTYDSGTTDQSFYVPNTAVFMRTSCTIANKDSFSIKFMDDVISKTEDNLLNVRFNSKVEIGEWMIGKYVYYPDGHIGNASDNSCSELILLNTGAEYTISGGNGIQYAIYKKDGTYISGGNAAGSFIVSGEAMYFRISCKTADLSSLSISYNFDKPVKKVIGSCFNEPTLSWTDGYYRRYNNGGISSNANWCYSNFIPVLPNEIVSCGWDSNHIAFFDQNYTYVDGKLNQNVVKIPDNAVYMTVSMPIVNKPNISINRKTDKIKLSTATYSDFNRAFSEAQQYLLPIYVYGGTWDISSIYAGNGLMLYTDLIGIDNPVFVANPSTFNEEFSIINLKGASKNKIIRVEGITFDATNMRYCVHDEMGSTTTDTDLHGYTHVYKNCTFISRENVYRPVGIGVGDDGLITFENCIFESTAENPPANLLDIHSGWQGQNSHTNSFVKDCIFINGTCSFTEIGNNDYSSDMNVCVATNNYCNAEPYVIRTNNKQIQFYSWNNHVVQ